MEKCEGCRFYKYQTLFPRCLFYSMSVLTIKYLELCLYKKETKENR